MTLDLNGIPTDLPLYDSQGKMLYSPESNENLLGLNGDDSAVDFTQRESTPEESQQAQALLNLVKDELSKVDDVGADLTVSDLVNVYAYNAEEGDREYYTVTIFGGKNGSGTWSNYLRTMTDLVLRLEATFDDVWIRKWDIDTADDIFEVEVAVLTYLGQLN